MRRACSMRKVWPIGYTLQSQSEYPKPKWFHSVTFTNSFEVAKTRLQLDGELQAKSTNYQRVYNNAFDALKKTWRTEGLKGVNVGRIHSRNVSSVKSRIRTRADTISDWCAARSRPGICISDLPERLPNGSLRAFQA
jgi:hypothetical protein